MGCPSVRLPQSLDRGNESPPGDDSREKGTPSAMSDQLLFLGTGSAWGIPNVGCQCPTCRHARTSPDPRDRRTRTSLLLRLQGHVILIDAGPDLRLQLEANGVMRLDAVLLSHGHTDHVI